MRERGYPGRDWPCWTHQPPSLDSQQVALVSLHGGCGRVVCDGQLDEFRVLARCDQHLDGRVWRWWAEAVMLVTTMTMASARRCRRNVEREAGRMGRG